MAGDKAIPFNCMHATGMASSYFFIAVHNNTAFLYLFLRDTNDDVPAQVYPTGPTFAPQDAMQYGYSGGYITGGKKYWNPDIE